MDIDSIFGHSLRAVTSPFCVIQGKFGNTTRCSKFGVLQWLRIMNNHQENIYEEVKKISEKDFEIKRFGYCYKSHNLVLKPISPLTINSAFIESKTKISKSNPVWGHNPPTTLFKMFLYVSSIFFLYFYFGCIWIKFCYEFFFFFEFHKNWNCL